MSEEHAITSNSKASAVAMILQIDRPNGESPLQFPAVIRNLVAGVATLEVNNPWTIMDWEALKGQRGCLRLLTETGDVSDLRGVVNWARYTVQGQDSGNLSLSLKLTNPDPSIQKQLTKFIPNTAEDLKGFWDSWEQAQGSQAQKVAPLPTMLGLAALALLLSGLVLQFIGATAFQFLGWLLWCGGTVVIASQILSFWKSRKVSN
jgi:hypothetical protein